MEWLKDKKNLPIVIGILVFVFIAAGGLIALEMGLIGGNSEAAAPPVTIQPVASPSPGPTPTGSAFPGPSGTNAPFAVPTAKTASVPIPDKSASPPLVNPGQGPDPFNIPNGHRTYLRIATGGASGEKLLLRDILPPFNLFTYHPPSPPSAPPVVDQTNGANTASNYVFSGIVSGQDGISAILEVAGQSQNVKPGDSLLDGGRVLSIQPNSVTIRTAGGAIISVPLTGGAGGDGQNATPDNGTVGGPNNHGQPFAGPQPFTAPQPFVGQPGADMGQQ